MWIFLGILLSFLLGATATWRSRTAPAYYESGYGMTATVHQRYAVAGWSFMLAFSALSRLHWEGGVVALFGAFTLVAILYASSFLRGAVHQDE
jgi:hypothetical protein